MNLRNLYGPAETNESARYVLCNKMFRVAVLTALGHFNT